jgi:hypothetical protein
MPTPEVIRCYFDDRFDPPLPAMCLHWPAEISTNLNQGWNLPAGICLTGPPPEQFGISIRREGEDAYIVRLLWNRTCLTWHYLTRAELLASSLLPLLEALGTDLWFLLDQPSTGISEPPNWAA